MTAMKITIGAGMPTVSAVDQDQHSNLLGPVWAMATENGLASTRGYPAASSPWR
jgi:hypothetical protein